MRRVKARDFAERIDESLEMAKQGTMGIVKRGRLQAVVISAKEFDHLRRLEDAYWIARAQVAEAGSLGRNLWAKCKILLPTQLRRGCCRQRNSTATGKHSGDNDDPAVRRLSDIPSRLPAIGTRPKWKSSHSNPKRSLERSCGRSFSDTRTATCST
jgi:PHD/YefM family antitoxin component YafN of YafNO toxin-antitoxin module